NEIAYCYERKNPFPYLAARFAAKEAMIKASGPMRDMRLAFPAIEILNEPSGKPFINILNSKLNSSLSIHLSMSHERTHAIATVVIEKGGEVK
ncbi:MAG: holo-ACP synthase, partial [Nitrospirae bacterium]|nr:holo-ACP synthase [Nitrospirota bacterium]